MSANPYDPVTTTDSTYLADDDWGLNLPSIRYKNYDSSRFKGVCNFVRERSRLFIILGCILIIGVVLISIIAVATHKSSGRHPSSEDKATLWSSPDEGIAFYPAPADGSTVISFSADDLSADNPIVQSLNKVMEVYDSAHQANHSVFMECTPNTHPADKTCRMNNHHFGDVCTKQQHWGYRHATPCVLLQLNLPNNTMIRPIPSDSKLWQVANMILHNHNDSTRVPVSCEGTEKRDRMIIGTAGYDKKDRSAIQYYPPEGFFSFFYRPRDLTLPFVKPAMMVRLTSLRDQAMVSVTCTAWGQLFDFSGKMIDHKLLATTFAMYVH